MKNQNVLNISSKQISDSINKLNSVVKPEYKIGSSVKLYIQECDIFFHNYFNLENLIFLHTLYKFTQKVYRVRPYSGIKILESLSQYSHPPKKITKIQRANLPYNPVFYCSLHPNTSLKEYIKNYSDKQVKFCVAVWSFKENTPNLKTLPIFKENLTDFFLNEQVELLFKNQSEDVRLGITNYFNFLGDIFLKEIKRVEEYSFSAYLANKFLYEKYSDGDTVDILSYPSVVSSDEPNFAIHPNIVAKYLNLEHVYIVEFLNEKIISTNFGLILFKKNIFDTKIENISLQDAYNKYTKMFLEDFKIEINE